MAKNSRHSGKSSKRKPLPERGTKNMRRDAEIADTASKEYADSRTRRDCYKSSANDWQWYAQNQQLVKDYASYPFGKALGSRLWISSTVSQPGTSGGTLINNQAIPGALVYYYQPSVGSPQDANAPINVAARNIYSFVRHANSGHTNYDAPDLMLYLIAMDSVYMYHSFMKRILGLLFDYSTLNRYYPESLIMSMGVDFDDISHHISDLRGFINQYAVKMGSMCIPNSMSYMARHVWMTEGLYTDASSAKAQTYMYVPCSYYKFGLDAEGKGQLQKVDFSTPHLGWTMMSNNLKKFADLVDFGNALLDPILSNEDLNIMSGDVLKAFGDSGVVKISGIADGYMVLPMYNQEVLSQMENATILGDGPTLISQNADVGGGYLQVSNATFKIAFDTPTSYTTASSATLTADQANGILASLEGRKILNFHHSDVAPEEVMVATRLSNIVDAATSTVSFSASGGVGQINMNVSTVGSEIITAAIAFQYRWANTNLVTRGIPLGSFKVLNYVDGNSSASTLQQYLNDIAISSTFDWHHAITPIAITWNVPSSSPVLGSVSGFG